LFLAVSPDIGIGNLACEPASVRRVQRESTFTHSRPIWRSASARGVAVEIIVVTAAQQLHGAGARIAFEVFRIETRSARDVTAVGLKPALNQRGERRAWILVATQLEGPRPPSTPRTGHQPRNESDIPRTQVRYSSTSLRSSSGRSIHSMRLEGGHGKEGTVQLLQIEPGPGRADLVPRSATPSCGGFFGLLWRETVTNRRQ